MSKWKQHPKLSDWFFFRQINACVYAICKNTEARPSSYKLLRCHFFSLWQSTFWICTCLIIIIIIITDTPLTTLQLPWNSFQSWTETAFQLQKAKQPRISQHTLAWPIRGLATVHALGLWTQPYRGTPQGPLKTRRFLRKNLRSFRAIPQSKSLPSRHSQAQRYS